MKKRLFICADRSFPRGDAGANRILYIAKALQECDWEVIVVSIGKNEDRCFYAEYNCYVYEGVKYKNISISKNGKIRTIEHNFTDAKKVVNVLKSFNANSNDVILLYSSSYMFSKNILKFSKETNIKVSFDIVEWHQSFQFKKGEKDIAYQLYKKFFEKLVPNSKNVITISKCLNEHFKKLNCNTIIVPIYVDADNREFPPKTIDENKIHLIYPGNPYRKDDLLSMLQAIKLLDISRKDKIVFHITGVNKKLLLRCIPKNENLLNELINENNVIIHSWLEYEELIKLYSMIDFALIARPDNIVTKANFPSKVPELFNKGIPVIINNIGDISNYLKNNHDAILYNGSDSENCKKAIIKAIDLSLEERIQMRNNAFESAYETFDFHKCAEILDEYFLNLV